MTELPPVVVPPESRPGRVQEVAGDGTGHMVAGTLVGALTAYLFQVLGGRALGPVGFAPITALWTVQFLVFTVLLLPVEQFSIRHSLRAETSERAAWGTVAAVVVASAAGTAAFVWATRRQLFGADPTYALIGGLMILAYGIFAVGRGRLAGRRRFRAYGWVTAGEGTARLAAAVVVLALAPSGVALAVTMVVGALVVVAWWPFGLTAEDRRVVDEEGVGAGRFLGPLMVANASSQTILAAGPLVVAALGGSPTAVSVFFVTFTLFRGPLTMAYNLLARILPPFTRLVTEGRLGELRRWVLRLVGGGFGLAAVGLAAGWWLGPWIVALLFGGEFRPGRLLASLAVGGMVLAIGALATNQVLVAAGRTSRLAAAWGAALVVAALAVLVTPLGAAERVGIGFLVGEAVAFAGVAALTLASPHVRADGD